MIQETKKVKLKVTTSQVRVAVEERSYFFVISLVALFDFFKTCVHLLQHMIVWKLTNQAI